MKKLFFGLIATVCTGVLSLSAQTSPRNFLKIDVGFGKVSSYAGPCVSASGMCSGSIGTSTTFDSGISRISEGEVSYAFSKNFYQQNMAYLKNGLLVDTSYSLPKAVSERLGFQGEFTIAKGTYNVTESDGYYFITLKRVK